VYHGDPFIYLKITDRLRQYLDEKAYIVCENGIKERKYIILLEVLKLQIGTGLHVFMEKLLTVFLAKYKEN
jgi:hypothetical protein